MSVKSRLRIDGAKFVVFVALSVVIAIILVVLTGNIRPGDQADYRAVFSDISGLDVGDEVRVASVGVGRVESISIQPGNKVRVNFTLDSSIRLTTATIATVRYKNLTGDRFLELQRGAFAGAPTIPPGSDRSLTNTAAALDLDTLLDGFRPLFVGLNPHQINKLSYQLIQVFQGQASAVYKLVSTLASFSTTIAERDQLIGRVIRSVGSVVNALDTREDSVGTILDQVTLLVQELERKAPEVLKATERIDTVASDATELLRGTRRHANPDLRSLRAVAGSLNDNSGQLQQMLNRWPMHYQEIARTGAYGNFFNFYLCGVRLRFSPEGEAKPAMTPWLTSEAKRCH